MVGGGAPMNRICWWLAELVGRMLEPSERESVRGDFAEAGEAGGPALLGVLGLVVRRQMSPWNGWRPWLALVGIVVPVGAFLTLSGVALSGGYDLSLWI